MRLGNFKYRTGRRSRQAGYLLMVLMIMVTMLAIAAIASAPSAAMQLKRDREDELVHRGAQYARAIKKFYKKFGRYPVSIEQLQNTSNIRFLRQRYKDPITGKDFRVLHFGEVQLTPKNPGAATGPGVAPSTSSTGSTFGQIGSSAGPRSGITSSQSGPGMFGSSNAGATFGGGPIIGVSSTSEKVSLKEFNNKNHYNQWEFIYDPTMDRGGLIQGPYVPTQAGAGGLVPGVPAGMTPTTTPQGGFGANPLGQPMGTQSPFGQPQQQQPPR